MSSLNRNMFTSRAEYWQARAQEAEALNADLLEAAKQALLHIEGDEMTHGRPFSAGDMLRAAIANAQPIALKDKI